MQLPPFALERYFAQHEFSATHLLCASDCQSRSLGDLLDGEPGSREKWESLGLGYTESAGHPELRTAIAALYERAQPEDVLVHAGAEEAIFGFMNVALGPGDHMIVHWPCYQSLFQVAETRGCEVTRWEGNPDRGWRLHTADLIKQFRPNTKAVVLNCPHNPTGYLMERSQFSEVAKLVESRGAILFMDEVYQGLEYEPGTALPSACDISPTAVSLGVMSKSFGLAGLRIGWVATKNQPILAAMAKFKDYTSMCNSAPSEFLSTLALRQRRRIFAENRAIIASNLVLLDGFFADHADLVDWARPNAGCIGFPRWKGGSSDLFCQAVLKKSGVLLAPGGKFAYGDSHFRIGFGRRNFPAALAALRGYFGDSGTNPGNF